jgi:ribosomal protein L9
MLQFRFHLTDTYFPTEEWQKETVGTKQQLRDNMKRLLSTLEQENAERAEDNETLQEKLEQAKSDLVNKASQLQEVNSNFKFVHICQVVQAFSNWNENVEDDPSSSLNILNEIDKSL